MSNYSPGRWHVYRTNGLYVADATNTSVACVLSRREPEEEAFNARLIAAAPELLQLLKLAVDYEEWPGCTQAARLIRQLESEPSAEGSLDPSVR